MIAFPGLAMVDHGKLGASTMPRLEIPVSNDFESAPAVFDLRPEDLKNYGGASAGATGKE